MNWKRRFQSLGSLIVIGVLGLFSMPALADFECGEFDPFCSSGSLIVQFRVDGYRPAIDFAAGRVVVFDPDHPGDASQARVAERTAYTDGAWDTGARVAEFVFRTGDYTMHLQLIDRDNQVLVQRPLIVEVEDGVARVVTALMFSPTVELASLEAVLDPSDEVGSMCDGDQIHYTATIQAEGAEAFSVPGGIGERIDPESVFSTHGEVVATESGVEVSGFILGEGETAVISFSSQVAPEAIQQGGVLVRIEDSGNPDSFASAILMTDDPESPLSNDPTVTGLGYLCEVRDDLQNCEGDLQVCAGNLQTCELDLDEVRQDLEEITDDPDEDGVISLYDQCEGTAPNESVDLAGCSLAQFCGAIDISIPDGRPICRLSDWQNDEPLSPPKDCHPTLVNCQPG